MDRNKFIEYINKKAKIYTKRLWNIEFDGILKINNRLRSTYAWFIEDKNIIEFNKQLLDLSDEYHLFIDEVLIHELCHWYCFKIGVDNEDGSFEFESEIYKSGARSTSVDDIVNNTVELVDNYSWFFCKDCNKDNFKAIKISQHERIISLKGGRIQEGYPNCPICNKKLTYYCEEAYEDNWVKWYPRKKLLELINSL